MSLTEAIEKASHSFLGWVFITVAGGFLWMVRRVFTNQKQIEMMQQALESRDKQREEDRQDLHEVKSDVRAIREHILRSGE